MKIPVKKVFCGMREGNLIGVDTNEAGALKENDIASTRELGSTYSELSCEFYRFHPIYSDQYLEKASIVLTENFESLLRSLGQLDKNMLNVTAGNKTGLFTVFF